MKSTPIHRRALAHISLPLLMAFLVGIGTAAAQVGLSQRQVGSDISEKLAEATAAMLVIEKFDILESKQIADGRYQIDIEMMVRADEQAIATALARAEANRLSSNWKQESHRLKRLANSAREKNGTTEIIRAIYQLNKFGAWELTEVSDQTSEYTRLRNLNGENSAPEEAQVIADFENMVRIISNDAAAISSFKIFSATAMPNNKVKLNIQMTLQGDGSAERNIDFARRVNGLVNTIEVVYARSNRGVWTLSQ